MNDIAHQYNSGVDPQDTASPISGAEHTSRLDLKSTIQRQQSQIELLVRDLRRTQARVRDLESRLDQVLASLRSS